MATGNDQLVRCSFDALLRGDWNALASSSTPRTTWPPALPAGHAGHAGDRLGRSRVLAAGAALFLLAYAGLAATGVRFAPLGTCFVAAGLGIGCAETAEHAARATSSPKASAVQPWLARRPAERRQPRRKRVAGALWTLISPAAAFIYAAGWMTLAAAGLLVRRPGRHVVDDAENGHRV
jgi:MFS family permease